MTRRTVVSLPFFLIGCGASGPDQTFSPPQDLPGAGALTAVSRIPESEIPDEIQKRGPEEAYQAEYAGTASVKVLLYRMGAGSSAFELVQTWRPVQGKLALYQGPWFVVVESADLDNAALSAIAGALESSLAGQ